MLKQDFAEQKIDVLEGWLNSAGEIARDGKSVQEEAERIVNAMTPDEAEAFWELYKRCEDLLMHVGQRQLASSDATLEDAEMRGIATLVYTRTIIDYDPDRGDLAGYLMTATRPHWRSYLRQVSPSDKSAQQRRIARLLYQLRVRKKTHEGRNPRLEEKIEYVQKRNSWARGLSQERVTELIREIEKQKKPSSLDEKVDDEEGGRTLHDIVPSPPQVSIDTEQVARIIAQATRREDLLDALLGEGPGGAFNEQKARQIYLERESRHASAKRIAWEHQTSPYVVAKIEDIYDLDLTIEDARRYGLAQGYIEPREETSVTGGSLTEDEIWTICERAEEETYGTIAKDYPVSEHMIGAVVRGDSYPDVPRPDVKRPPRQVLTDSEVAQICERYQEEDMTYDELAGRYDVDSETIGGVVRGETHQHIDRPEPETRILSPQQVREIRRRYDKEDVTYDELADNFAVSSGTIGAVVRGETYTDVQQDEERSDEG